MSNLIIMTSKMTAEDNTLQELLDEGLVFENTEKTARIFQKQKSGRPSINYSSQSCYKFSLDAS